MIYFKKFVFLDKIKYKYLILPKIKVDIRVIDS
jgi:hypothetical protein